MAKSKNKNFKDWMEQDDWSESETSFSKKDGKRYDRKKAKVQSARRNKNKNKFSHLD